MLWTIAHCHTTFCRADPPLLSQRCLFLQFTSNSLASTYCNSLASTSPAWSVRLSFKKIPTFQHALSGRCNAHDCPPDRYQSGKCNMTFRCIHTSRRSSLALLTSGPAKVLRVAFLSVVMDATSVRISSSRHSSLCIVFLERTLMWVLVSKPWSQMSSKKDTRAKIATCMLCRVN